jgi:hypothetical protein
MRRSPRQVESLLFYFFLATLFSFSLLHVLTGYADNGDFSRSAGFIFEKPLGFSTMWPSTEAEEWKRRFFTEWHDEWIFLPNWPDPGRLFSLSSYKIYLLIQARLEVLITGDNSRYSIILGSLLSRGILYSTIAVLLIILRRRLPLFAFWLFAIPAAVVFLNAGWIAFLNSLYEEQIAIIFLPILAVLLIRYFLDNSLAIGIALLILATITGSAKPAYFYLPVLTAVFIFPVLDQKFA